MNLKHGLAPNGKRIAEYNAWTKIKQRCRNPRDPKYQDYGNRGIKVCKRWNDFCNFFADMGLKPGVEYSIDRVDNNGNYEPGNCRWSTSLEQANNRRPKRTGRCKQRLFIAMDLQGTMIASNNQSEFARQYELEQVDISACLRKKRKIVKGWRFSYDVSP